MKTLNRLGLAAAIVLPAAFAMAGGSSTPAPNAKVVTGSAKGTVSFDGEAPEAKKLTVSAEQGKGCCKGSDGTECMDTSDRSVVVGKDGGLANVVVTLKMDGKAEPAAEKIVLDQSKCRFEPHVLVMPVGSTIAYLNSDEVSHNVHTYAKKNSGLNKTVSGGTELTQKLDKEEAIKVTCDIHPWMTSWIFVTDSPKYAVTGADGTFEIPGLEPGTYKVELWHETLGKGKGEVTIAADGSSEMMTAKLGGSGGSSKKKRRR